MATTEKVVDVKVVPVVASPEEIEKKIHTDARDKRIAVVKANIETARLARVELEKKGITETPGAKSDREAQEKKDLEKASILYVREPIDLIGPKFGNGDDEILREKINEIIDNVNKIK